MEVTNQLTLKKMSVIIECNGNELWSPSLRIGKLFYKQVTDLEEVVGVKSGIDSFVDDMYEIDSVNFNSFVNSVIQVLETTTNGPLIAMMSGCLEICIALNAEITNQWPTVSERLKPVILRAKLVMQKNYL